MNRKWPKDEKIMSRPRQHVTSLVAQAVNEHLHVTRPNAWTLRNTELYTELYTGPSHSASKAELGRHNGFIQDSNHVLRALNWTNDQNGLLLPSNWESERTWFR